MFVRAGSSSGWEELMAAIIHLDDTPTSKVLKPSIAGAVVLAGLASFPSPLAGWPYHEYAHSGLSHSQERPPSSIGQTPWQPGRPPTIPCLLMQWVLVHCSRLQTILFSGDCFTSTDISLKFYWSGSLNNIKVTI